MQGSARQRRATPGPANLNSRAAAGFFAFWAEPTAVLHKNLFPLAATK